MAKKKKEYDPLKAEDFSNPITPETSGGFTAEKNEAIRNAILRRNWKQQRDREDPDFASRLERGSKMLDDDGEDDSDNDDE